jgi:hypothetical protein
MAAGHILTLALVSLDELTPILTGPSRWPEFGIRERSGRPAGEPCDCERCARLGDGAAWPDKAGRVFDRQLTARPQSLTPECAVPGVTTPKRDGLATWSARSH